MPCHWQGIAVCIDARILWATVIASPNQRNTRPTRDRIYGRHISVNLTFCDDPVFRTINFLIDQLFKYTSGKLFSVTLASANRK